MAEREDELLALAAADPALGGHSVHASDPEAVALFERIVMSENKVRAGGPPSWSRPVLVAAAAAAVVVAGIVGVRVTGDDGSAPDEPDDEIGSGPIGPGGANTGSCVELYDLVTLADRELAFAGTVTDIDGDTATFDVERWFRGGEGGSVELRGASTMNDLTSSGGALLELGSRLLVAGDGGFAWSCGFTQPYDDVMAAQWAEVFSG